VRYSRDISWHSWWHLKRTETKRYQKMILQKFLLRDELKMMIV
jgi:hypothetical protein